VTLDSLTDALRPRDIALLAAIGLATAVTGLLLSHPEGSVFHRIVEAAAWLRGGAPKPEVVTWPAWGYALIIAVVPRFEWIIVLQVCFGAMVLTALAIRLRLAMPRQARIVAVLCVLAIPWHDMQLTLYPSGLAGSLVLAALLVLDAAMGKNNLKAAVIAGILLGLAQNLRTEFVLVPAFIGICALILKGCRVIAPASMKPMGAFILTALALQLPWAIFYHAETGRFSLTESNFGHVMYVSLGSSANNPWGIVGDDEGAMKAVHDEGYSFSSLSEPGNQVLRRLVWTKVKQYPYGVVLRTLQQLRNTIVAPFNWGEPKLDQSSSRDLDLLRQELKARLGVGVNVAKLSNYRDENLRAKASENTAAALAMLYQVAAVGFGSLVFLLGIVGIVLALVRAETMHAPLLLWFLASAAMYKVIQDVLLAYQVNYLNNVYPMVLPFAAVSLSAMHERLRRAGG
jgi:4-amino-4-deoxy-L-arabinose transferase-like glycosyltransferase